MKEYRHIVFENYEVDLENYIGMKYACINKAGVVLGSVEWCEEWKQFCYFDGGTKNIYSKTCLLDIADFVGNMNKIYNKFLQIQIDYITIPFK